MKRTTLIIFAFMLFVSCKSGEKAEAQNIEEPKIEIAAVTDEMMESAIIYEINVRQYSTEGTFDAFTKDIPQLKELGVKVIWMMPIFPISEKNRKAEDKIFTSSIKDPEERKKYLGSYYAPADYKKTNPEFGTIEDFRELLNTAHKNGMYVILDWVPNHTGWDHPWITSNPEFYQKNEKGEISEPLHEDGTSKGYGDVAQLDFSNKMMQEEMIKDMLYWVEEENVDGFRCDHVDPTPISFWKEALLRLQKDEKLFLIAESGKKRFLKDNLFDMGYGWDTHFTMFDIVNGNKTVKDWDDLMVRLNTEFEADDYFMNFVTNHDENSWKGTIDERFGDAKEMVLALSYTIPGMPLIYSGQEYGLNHQLKFFMKDSIPKTKGKVWQDLVKLGELKNSHIALNGGKNAASYERIKTNNENILLFKRSKEDQTILFVANFSANEEELNNVPSGKFLNYMKSEEENYKGTETIKLKPWEYKILLQN